MRKSLGSRSSQRETVDLITKGKMDKLGPIKMKTFCSVKDPIDKIKRQATG